MPSPTLEVTEEQALWFRARRSHLVCGAEGPVSAAHALLGAQAQQETMALHGLSLRTDQRPTLEALRRQLLPPPSLVRCWGQRDTLHVYDPEDWRDVAASLDAWPRSGRRGGMPPPELLDEAREVFRKADRPLLRTDLFPLLPHSYVRELAQHPGVGKSPERMGASRLIWLLAREGEVCFGEKHGAEWSYAPRRLWFPDLDWPEVEQEEAMRRLLARYLATFAPATPADAAHFFGAKVGTVKRRLGELGDNILTIDCGGRKGLVALASDLDELREEPPGSRDWPPRLLPQWDGHLMTHKDKSWVVPDADEEQLVWRKAALVAASVLDRGRIVATWHQKTTVKKLSVTLTPLAGWRRKHLSPVRREVEALALHLGREESEIVLA